MMNLKILNFNFFFKKKLLKSFYKIKKKSKLKFFCLYFKICNNNAMITIVHKKNVIFWKTCKMFKAGSNFKEYSGISLTNLTKSCIFFLKKLNPNKSYQLNFFFSGLNKFRKLILKLFFKNKFFIRTVLDLKGLSHNGVRGKKKRRLAKRRSRKVYQYSEIKQKLKKKKERLVISIKSNNFFFLKESLLKINFLFFLHLFGLRTSKFFSYLSLLRSVHNYGKHRQKFFYVLYKTSLFFFIQRSWLLRVFFLNYFKCKEINKFDSFFRFFSDRKSYKF